jgi:hypothetical protein
MLNIASPKIFAKMLAQSLFGDPTSAYATLHRTPGSLNFLGVRLGVRVDVVATVIHRQVLEAFSL